MCDGLKGADVTAALFAGAIGSVSEALTLEVPGWIAGGTAKVDSRSLLLSPNLNLT